MLTDGMTLDQFPVSVPEAKGNWGELLHGRNELLNKSIINDQRKRASLSIPAECCCYTCKRFLPLIGTEIAKLRLEIQNRNVM